MAHEVPARPDACYREFYDAALSLLDGEPTAAEVLTVAAEAGACIHYIGRAALQDAERGQVLFGGPLPSDEISELLASTKPQTGGVFNDLIWKVLENLVRQRAADPANLDLARTWIAQWLKSNH